MNHVAGDDSSRCLTVFDEEMAFVVDIHCPPRESLSTGKLDHDVSSQRAASMPIGLQRARPITCQSQMQRGQKRGQQRAAIGHLV